MIALALVVVAVLLAGPAPRVMARLPALRRSPRAALLAWQAVTLAAILAALAAAPATLPIVLVDGQAVWQHVVLIMIAGAVSLIVLVRFLVAGHRIGTRMRELRERHRELVDIIAEQDVRHPTLRILEHPAPTAYCLPGHRRGRVVVSRGVLLALSAPELGAVLAHEQAHLRARHDLLIEFFSVIHETVPEGLRATAAMSEVRLLAEVLADRQAASRVGVSPTVRALGVLSAGPAPEASLSVSATATAPIRIRLLQDGPSPRRLTGAIYTYAALVLGLPIGLALLAIAT
ncbi:MAG: M56 family metallopeptidase [Nostocoides sp.]